MNGMSKILEKHSYDGKEEAKKAAHASTMHMLTAQERLQQHIKKSAQEGTVYGKPLEKVERTRRPAMTKVVESVEAQGESSALNHVAVKLVDANENAATNVHKSGNGSAGVLANGSTDPNAATSINGGASKGGSESKDATIFPGGTGSGSVEVEKGGAPNELGTNAATTPSLAAALPLKLEVPLMKSPIRSPVKTQARTPTRTPVRTPARSASPSRSRSGSTVSVRSDISIPLEPGEKRVRFAGVKAYTVTEDAPTARAAQKQLRQRWAAYKPMFRKLNSQEGLAFKEGKEREKALQRERFGFREGEMKLEKERDRERERNTVDGATRRLSRMFWKK